MMPLVNETVITMMVILWELKDHVALVVDVVVAEEVVHFVITMVAEEMVMVLVAEVVALDLLLVGQIIVLLFQVCCFLNSFECWNPLAWTDMFCGLKEGVETWQ